MDDLSEFLLARVAEDEAVAQAATSGPWGIWAGQRHAYIESLADSDFTVLVQSSPRGTDADIAHIARHDPARVLAECEAKRRIVELHHISDEDIYDADGTERPGKDCTECWDEFPCETLRLLALPHAEHPDYRDEWRP